VEEAKKVFTVRCPQCRRETPWVGNPHRPFCSERCKLIDLGAWASEEYAISEEEEEDLRQDEEEQ